MPAILVLEDDLHFREALHELLKLHGYEVFLASSAEEAVAEAQNNALHLILADVRIAGDSDGVTALETILYQQPLARSIIMTGFADEEVPRRAARLRADDYLQKPFKLNMLVDAIRAVLERDAPFRGFFQRLAIHSHGVDLALQRLNEARSECLQVYFLLLRARSISQEEAYAHFCAWERLEKHYLAPNAHDWEGLTIAYRDLQSSFYQPVQDFQESATLTRERFEVLLQRIDAGTIEWCQLLPAIYLLHYPEIQRIHVEAYATYHWLWGLAQTSKDPFQGLEVAGYRLQRCRSVPSAGARLYEVPQKTPVRQEDLVLVIPAQEDNLLEREISSGRARLLETRDHHHFLLYPGHHQRLKAHIPASGLYPEQAWKAIRPIFEEVQRHHEQGRVSGCFSLRDILYVPGEVCRLGHFSPVAYQEHHHLLVNGAICTDLCVAPEVCVQPAPTAASDLFVLGRILLEVILGGAYAQPSTPLYLRFLGDPESNQHFRAYLPHLGPLATPFYRLCHHDPTQRFSSVLEAIGQIDKALTAPLDQ